MKYKLDEMFAYRFYEKKKGPFESIRQFNFDEVTQIGKSAGITNIHEIYNNRVLIENLLLRMFKHKGGVSEREYPYYATVFDKLPRNNQLHVRFSEPECLKIPMKEFPRDKMSFTYGQSPRALTRKDNHPTRRKVLLWDEAEWALNHFPFVEDEGTWLEMQIWEDETLKRFYQDGKGENISSFIVEERLSQQERDNLMRKFADKFSDIKSELFFSPTSVHGVSHAMRVLVLCDVIAEKLNVSEKDRFLLKYAAAFHDIGRLNHKENNYHGYNSYRKMELLKLLPKQISKEDAQIIKFAIEMHPLSIDVAKRDSSLQNIADKNRAIILLSILKDADTLDRCRFGNVDISYLLNSESKKLVNFGYQLLTMYPEIIN